MTEPVPTDMPDRNQPIDRDPAKPPPEESGTGDEPGSVRLDRILTRLVVDRSATSDAADRSASDGTIDRDPQKPSPEESGVWNKRGSRTVDRIVEWLVPTDSED